MILIDNLKPWFFTEDVLLYGIGSQIEQQNGSCRIPAYFTNPADPFQTPKKVLLSWGCIPMLMPGFIYRNGVAAGEAGCWPGGQKIVTGEFSLSGIQPAAPDFEPFAVIEEFPTYGITSLDSQQCFHFALRHDSSSHFLVPSTEVIRAFFAPTTGLALKLVSSKGRPEDYFCSYALRLSTLYLELAEDAPSAFKYSSDLMKWLGWIICVQQLQDEWARIKACAQAGEPLKAQIPEGLHGTVRYRGLRFSSCTLILTMELTNLTAPFRDIVLEYSKKKQISSAACATSDADCSVKTTDTAEVLANSASAQGFRPQAVSIPAKLPAFKSVQIRKKPKNIQASAVETSKTSTAKSRTSETALENPQPDGTVQQGDLTPEPELLMEQDCPPELREFLQTVNKLIQNKVLLNCEKKTFHCPDPALPYSTMENGHPRSYMIIRGQHQARNGRIRTVALLEIGTAPGQHVSTLVFRCLSGEKLERLGQTFIDQYCRDGHWNRKSPGMEKVSLVRHCIHHPKALTHHIEACAPG